MLNYSDRYKECTECTEKDVRYTVITMIIIATITDCKKEHTMYVYIIIMCVYTYIQMSMSE